MLKCRPPRETQCHRAGSVAGSVRCWLSDSAVLPGKLPRRKRIRLQISHPNLPSPRTPKIQFPKKFGRRGGVGPCGSSRLRARTAGKALFLGRAADPEGTKPSKEASPWYPKGGPLFSETLDSVDPYNITLPYIYIYTHTHTHIYIYRYMGGCIYIYMEISFSIYIYMLQTQFPLHVPSSFPFHSPSLPSSLNPI